MAANVVRGVPRSQKIHPKQVPHRTGRLQNSRQRQSGLLEEILYPVVGGVAFGLANFNRNPIDVANHVG